MNKVADEEIYRLRDLASGEDEKDYSIAVDSKTLFEMCVELEIHRYDGLQKRVTDLELELEDVRDSQPFIAWVKIRDGREHLMCGPVMIALVIFTGIYWITAVGQGICEDTLYKTIEEAKAAVEKIFVK